MPIQYNVQQGDSIGSIGFAYGLFPDTIWNHPDNAALKQLRGNPDILQPGDIVIVPDKVTKQVSKPTDQTHVFRRKGVPGKLRLRVMDGLSGIPMPDTAVSDGINVTVSAPAPVSITEQPLALAPYQVTIDGKLTSGATDQDGYIEITIPPNARQGELVVQPGTPQERRIALRLGGLNPIDNISGMKQRLANLGYGTQDSSEDVNDAFTEALEGFQGANGLPVTGEPDDQTKQQLLAVHGN